MENSKQRAEHGGLSAPVRPQHTDYLARLALEEDPGQHPVVPERVSETVNFQPAYQVHIIPAISSAAPTTSATAHAPTARTPSPSPAFR